MLLLFQQINRHRTKEGAQAMEGKKIAYVRVSTIEQNEQRQVEGLEKHNIDKWFVEKVSGKDTNRAELNKMLDYVREGDVIYIHDLSRLARSTKDLLTIVETLDAKGVALVSNKESIDTGTPQGKLMLGILGAINQFERENLLERQREGIRIAKEQGKYKGKQPIKIDDDIFNKEYSRYMNREITKTKLAEILKISRPTLDKIIAEKTK